MEGHHAEVWGLSISQSGQMLVSTSHDRSIRVWHQTDEPFFIEEERERRLESMFEEGVENVDALVQLHSVVVEQVDT